MTLPWGDSTTNGSTFTAWTSLSSTDTGWSAPVTITHDSDRVVAELTNSRHGIFGVGDSLAAALADLRQAIREFGCVLGGTPCPDHPESSEKTHE